MSTLPKKFPASEDELDKKSKQIIDLACEARFEEALKICSWLIQNEPTKIVGYRNRAFVYDCMEKIDDAVADLKYVIARSFPVEPHDLYTLGIIYLNNLQPEDAIEVFTKVINIGLEFDFDYYRDGALLFRAEAYLNIRNYALAIEDCLMLPDGYKTHIGKKFGGMRSKEDILRDASIGKSKPHDI